MSNILLIEPNRLLSQTYQQALELAGHRVKSAGNAQAAITAADSFEPDVVVLEIQLAQHSGAEFLYEFRSYADWQKIPIIILSDVPASELSKFKQTFSKLFGIRHYLYKPQTRLSALVQTVNSLTTSRV